MPKLLAVRHVHFEDLGLFEGVLRSEGFSVEYLEAGIDDIAGTDPAAPDLVIVLGGPIAAYEEHLYPFITDELRFIERRVMTGRPLIGVCLGAQLIAKCLGARVFAAQTKEVGWGSLTLSDAGRRSPLAHFAPDRARVLHWHGDTFDLPLGSTHLASTEAVENQAFSLTQSVLGLQFHGEADAGQIERWLVGHAHELAALSKTAVLQLRSDSQRFGSALARQSVKFMRDWLATARLSQVGATQMD